MKSSINTLVFTDLDGTLLDRDTYSWEPARETIERLKSRGIPIIFCTSKTRAEIEYWQAEIGITCPFISENGGAVFVPRGYFKRITLPYKTIGTYNILGFGTPYRELRAALNKLRHFGEILGFGDMTSTEISRATGLTLGQAAMAKHREYDEPFTFSGDEPGLKEAVAAAGLKLFHGGRFWHLTGNNDKGAATKTLITLFRLSNPRISTIGIGNSMSDLPLLKAVDTPILVKDGGTAYSKIRLRGMLKIPKPGPKGWAQAIELLEPT